MSSFVTSGPTPMHTLRPLLTPTTSILQRLTFLPYFFLPSLPLSLSLPSSLLSSLLPLLPFLPFFF